MASKPEAAPGNPIHRAVAALESPGWGGGEAWRAALRGAMERVASAYVEGGGARAGGRLQAYAEGVGAYLARVSPLYPVDARRVALNAHIRPRTWAGGLPPGEGGGEPLLVDPEGVIYADPLAVLAEAARPYAVGRVLFAGGGVRPPAEAAAHLEGAGFVWPPGAFPLAGAFLEGGGLLVRGPDGPGGRPAWTHIAPGAPELGELVADSAPRVGAPPPRPPWAPPPGGAGAPPPEQTSALKGARGEAAVQRILAEGGFAVRDVSHRARSADMVVGPPGGEVYVEAKAYSAAVPAKEMEKFRRDLGARGAAAGVLVSLSSGIVGVRGVLSARLAALPESGRMVPLVCAASSHPEVVRAAVSLAGHLARLRPEAPGARVLHGEDALESYTVGLEALADAYEDARADLARFAAEAMERCGGVLAKVGGALRDHRRLAKVQRAALDPPADAAVEGAALWGEVARRYPVAPGAEGALAGVLRRLGASALGDIRPASRWRFQKTKAVHLSTGVALLFRKKRTEVCVPLPLLGPGRVGALVGRHPKKVRIADGALALELGGATEAEALALW